MKQFASILTILLFAVSFVAAQDAKTITKADQKVSGAAMAFEAETIDYGVIDQGAEPVRVFKFTNTGTEPLIIKNAQGSCGCTVPSYSTAPVLPGETSEIKVKYDTNRVGKFTKTVTLTTNANPETMRLTIKGEVLAKDKPTGVPSGQKSIINN
ncbi:MAG: DUF1573 domain-containing protein [Saprospiraceae bacterium]|nr:DUF1573 domain-containing protein [Saprospiraceae bacterium]